MQVVDNYVSAIAVGLFSFLSSYGIEIKYQKDKAGFYKWLIKKFFNVIVLYICFCFLKMILNISVASSGMMWINAFLLSYVIEGVSHKLLLDRAWIIIVVFWTAYSIVVHVFPNPFFWWPHQSLGFAYGSVFYVLVANKLIQKKRAYRYGIIIFCALISLGMIYLYIINGSYPNVSVVMQIERNIATLMMLVMVVQVMLFVTMSFSMLEYIGKMSLIMFFIHGIWIEILKPVLNGTLYVLVVVLLTLFTSGLINLLIRKITVNIKYISWIKNSKS
ncbi:hypothetical protein [Butyrivibrio proteoclasticus]|nr:hypothetical protein [Butyrivibrio proteoclasticus]